MGYIFLVILTWTFVDCEKKSYYIILGEGVNRMKVQIDSKINLKEYIFKSTRGIKWMIQIVFPNRMLR